ncbi:MAG: hypothetical protein ACI97K_000279 [Glaciecola sp.]|jgi:hypothetical protein
MKLPPKVLSNFRGSLHSANTAHKANDSIPPIDVYDIDTISKTQTLKKTPRFIPPE